jgi:carbamoyltransferase
MKILGISAYYHDSAAAIINDGIILAAAQEERFTRIKHDASFPTHAVKYCLEYSGFSLQELDAIVFYDKPLLKFERLLETYYTNAPGGIKSFVTSMPVWIKEKIFLRKLLLDELCMIEKCKRSKIKLLFTEHHLSHAASAFYPSGFNEAAIVTLDGVGEWATASICHGKGNSIKILKELHFPHSLGLLYSAFTYFLGFKVNSGEYKLMGLAPYGIANSANTLNYIKIIRDKLVEIKEDGSILLNRSYFNFETGLRMIHEKKWEELFGFKTRLPESETLQEHCDLAYAIQFITNEIVLKIAVTAKELSGAENLCIAGGVALNCVANGHLIKSGLFKEIFIQPASGDGGGALGAALASHYIYFDQERTISKENLTDSMQGAYLGPEYSDITIEAIARKYNAPFVKHKEFEEVAEITAGILDNGYVVGWFQDRMEFGPRALGNRSILGDARNPEMQKKLNLKIKYREGFRPFAPSVLAEDVSEYFEMSIKSPYMLLVADVVKERRKELPDNYDQMSLMPKLYIPRSDIPAITHVDFSARVQTVHKETNEKYWTLINKFKELTGYGVIVNTSFNVRGEPIVCSPEHAYICFMNTEMDYLVMGNYIFDKKLQLNKPNNQQFISQIKPD